MIYHSRRGHGKDGTLNNDPFAKPSEQSVAYQPAEDVSGACDEAPQTESIHYLLGP